MCGVWRIRGFAKKPFDTLGERVRRIMLTAVLFVFRSSGAARLLGARARGVRRVPAGDRNGCCGTDLDF